MDADHAVAASPRRSGRGGAVRLVVLVAAVALGLALAAVAGPVLLDLTACSAAERRVFAEVPTTAAPGRDRRATARPGAAWRPTGPALIGSGTHVAVHVTRG
jgi:hypothetical protein